MYILFFKPNFKFSRIFTKCFWHYTLIRFGIRLFTNSRFHHVAFTLDGKLISEAIYNVGYRVIPWKESFKDQENVDVYAYKIKKDIDLDKFKRFQKNLLSSPYDLGGAIFSAMPTFLERLFEKKPDDKDVFCSEAMIMLFTDQFWIKKVNNKNSFNPEEFRKILINQDVADESKIILAWKGNKEGKEIFRSTLIFN